MKKIIIRVIAAVILFSAVVTGIIFINIQNMGSQVGYSELTAPTLPTVSFSFAGYETNLLYGYRSEEAAGLIYPTLLPVDEERNIEMIVQPYGSGIEKVKVQLRSMDKERLIEEQEWTEFSGKTEPFTISYRASGLIEEKTEYLLSVRIVLKDGSESWYCTRIAQLSLENKEALLGLAKQFSDATISKEESIIRPYLTYDKDKAGTDLSYVNLNTSYNLVSWAGLQPSAGEKRLAIYEWSDSQITANFIYDCTTEYEGEKSAYEVEETYCVRIRDDKLYLLNYERYIQEIFSGDASSMGNTSILLGITQPEKLDMLYTNYGIFVTFVVNGGVWNYNYNTNTLTKVFSFRDGTNDVRRINEEHEIKLIGTDKDENVYFSVLGYMNCGKHEGQVGLSLYRYNMKSQELLEYFFAESKQPFIRFSGQAANLSYLNEAGLYYVDFEGCIYSIDLASKECLTLAKGVDENRVLVNEKGNLAVWQKLGDSSEISLLDMQTGQIRTIQDEDGRELFQCGFIEEDFVYAVCTEEAWEKAGFEYRTFYDELLIVNSELEVQSHYKKENTYLSSIKVEEHSIIVGRVQKQGSSYQEISEDVLALTEHQKETAVVEIKVAASEIKRNYYYINLGRVVTNAQQISTDIAKLIADEAYTFALGEADLQDGGGEYKACSGGHVIGSADSAAQAIYMVFDTMGTVYRKDVLIWNRGMRDLYLTVKLPVMSWTLEGHEDEMAAMDSLERGVDILIWSGVNAGVVEEETASSEERENCKTVQEELTYAFGEHLLNLSGCQISQLLYYLNLRHPVLAVTDEDTALILVGYTSSTVQIYDPATRETSTVEQDEAQEYFDEQNTIFVSFW